MARRPLEGIRSRILVAALTGLAVAALALFKPSGAGAQSDRSSPTAMSTQTDAAVDTKMPEETKVRLEHHLQIERLLLDKALIGLLLLIAGYGVNILIESFKAAATQNQYLLDKRLTSALAVRKALTDVTTPMFRITAQLCALTPPASRDVDEMKANANALAATLNTHGLLLDEPYLEGIGRAVQIFLGFAEDPKSAGCESRPFLADVALYVTEATRHQITPRPFPVVDTFVPVTSTAIQIDEIGTPGYLKRNFEHWQVRQTATAASSPLFPKK